jgi:hypothetical protein
VTDAAQKQSRLAWAIVAICIAFAWLWPFPYFELLNNPNENVRVYMTRAMVEDGTFAIDRIIGEWGYVNDKATFDGHMYAGKGPGASYLAVPFYAVYHALLGDSPVSRLGAVAVCRLGASILPVLLFVFAFARFTRRVTDSTGLRTLAVVTLALGSTMFPYSILMTSHGTAAAAVFGGAMCVFRHTDEPDRPIWPMLCGFLLGWTVALEYPGALGGALIGLWALWRSRRPAWFFVLAVLGGVFPIGLVMLYHSAFGGILENPYSHLENPDFRESHSHGFFGMVRMKPEAVYGSYLAPWNGLFWFMPWTLPTMLALGLGVRVRQLREPATVTTLILVVYTVFVSWVDNWRGGWTAGPRYIVPVVPFLVWYMLLVLAWIRDNASDRVRTVAVLVAAASVALGVFACGVSAIWFPHYPEEVRNPIFEIALFLADAGLAPLSLGHALGLDGLMSIAPALVAIVVASLVAIGSALPGAPLVRTARLVAVAACVWLVLAVAPSVLRTEDDALWRARQTVLRVWEPFGDVDQRLMRGGLSPQTLVSSSPDELRAIAQRAAWLGHDQTAMQLFRMASDREAGPVVGPEASPTDGSGADVPATVDESAPTAGSGDATR